MARKNVGDFAGEGGIGLAGPECQHVGAVVLAAVLGECFVVAGRSAYAFDLVGGHTGADASPINDNTSFAFTGGHT